jgi:TPR repeat protein
MNNRKQELLGLVPAQTNALSTIGTNSLATRGLQHLRYREKAEEWLVKGLEFNKAEKFEEAFASYRQGIEIDPENSIVQLALGGAYRNLFKYPEIVDCVMSMFFFRKAADEGHAVAQYCLATGHSFGEGVPHDPPQALYWFRQSATQGLRLGLSVLAGEVREPGDTPLPLSDIEAALWRTKFEEQRGIADKSILASLVPDGIGLPDNVREGLVWYREAVRKGSGEAQFLLWDMFVA